MQADSYGHHRTVGLCQRLMCCNGERKAKQEHQQGSRQQKVFAGAGTWAAIVISYALKLAGLLRSPRVSCRDVCGRKAGEDWDLGSPPLGSSLCPPLLALLCLCRCSLSFSQCPHPDPLIMTTPRALTLSPSAHPLFS